MKKSIDFDRFITSICIIAIHIYPFSFLSEQIDYVFTRVLFRICVPFFLMITGYYLLPKVINNKDKLKEYSKKILKLYFISSIVYIPINIYNGYFSNLNIITLLKDIFINGTFYHLWYFPALLFGVWLTYYLLKHFPIKITKIIVILSFVIGLFGDSYYGIVKDISLFTSFYHVIFSIFDYTRNGIFYVPIFLIIGYVCKMEENNLSYHKNLLLIFFFFIVMLIEGMILYHFQIPKHTSMYFSLIPLSYFLFKLVVRYHSHIDKKWRSRATIMYIMHPFFLIIVRMVTKNSYFNNSMIIYIAVIFMTYIFILLIEQIESRCKSATRIREK